MISEAVILAGGLGTRLRSAVPDLPKCMAPVAGRPFLYHLLTYYRKQGINRFLFSLGYKHEIIEEYLRSAFADLDFQCSVEDEPLGTGGGIRQAALLAGTKDILVLNGDTFLAIDISALFALYQAKQAACALSLKPMNHFDRYGVVDIDGDQRIISFREKRFYVQGLINGGAYLLNAARFLEKGLPLKFSFEKDYLEAAYSEGTFYGSVQEGYFIDIGIPEDFRQANEDFLNFSY